MSNVIEFKSKDQLFENWFNMVVNTNALDKKDSVPKSAIIMWEGKNSKGEDTIFHARYNVDTDTLSWYSRCIAAAVQERRFDEWMREHLDEYIEFINK